MADAVSDVWIALIKEYGGLRHKPNCKTANWPYEPCTCGLKEALGEDFS